MATEEQSKKRIVRALRELRAIITQTPRRVYPDGLKEHPEVRRLHDEIVGALSPYSQTLDHQGVFRWFVPVDVFNQKELPAEWDTIRWLDHYIERYCDDLVLVRPDGRMPKKPAEDPEWKAWIDAVMNRVNAATRGAGACWHENHSDLVEAGFKDQAEFKRLHKSYRQRIRNEK